MSETHGESRFRDFGVRLWQFADEILVRCPRCDGRAVVVAHPDHRAGHRYPAGGLTAPHRLVCSGCGATGEWRARRERNYVILPTFSGPDDPARAE